MTQSLEKLAQTVGVDKKSVHRAKKSLGITNETLTNSDAEAIKDALQPTVELKRKTKAFDDVKSDEFVPEVRRIDQSDDSSVLDMLQDCKEQYVANEKLIKRLRYEIDHQQNLMHGNSNGTLSSLPQLGIMEKLQKVNISLRNQIMNLESELGRNAEPRKEDDPFE